MWFNWHGFVNSCQTSWEKTLCDPPPQLKKIVFIEVQLTYIIFLGSKITVDGDCSHEIKSHLLLGRKAMTNIDNILKAETLLCQDPSSQGYGFSSGHIWMWELDCKESWVLKNWCFWTMVLEETLEVPLDCKEIKPVNPKEISPEYSLEGLMLRLKLQ